ncbi:MAG: sulfatase [Myxococcota bacterium]
MIRSVGLSRPCHTLLLSFVMLVPGCASEPRLPHVVLISIDTLRPDHLSIYGYGRHTDAPLADMFEAAVVFDNAVSTSSWTAPAMASLITSMLPEQHGITTGRVKGLYVGRPTDAEFQPVLGDSFTTLGEHLEAKGYTTFGISTNPHVSAELGFAQGIGNFERLRAVDPDPVSGNLYADAVETNAVASRLRERIDASGPVFLWIHYVDPHTPYRARLPWLVNYVVGPTPDLPPSASAPSSFVGISPKRQARRRLLEAYYDAEISFVMQQISELVEQLDLGDHVLFVLTSDHGEAFFEHGYHGHSTNLHETEVRIPLLIRFPEPGPVARRVREPVSIIDIMPTLLDYLGVPIDPQIQGRSLLSLARGESDPVPVPVFGNLSRRKTDDFSFVRSGRWKLIRNNRANDLRLYDLDTDPRETDNLVGSEPRIVKELAALLAAQRARPRPRIEAFDIDDESARQLDALGYSAD